MSLYSKLVKNPLLATVSNHIDGYPTPVNLTYLWGFGSLAGIALGVQIVTGVLLAMHYAAEIHLAFTSVEHIMRDVRGGSTLRYIHANGASMFFIVVYTHMFRGLYYGSYFQPRANLWYSGIVIFFLMMATAFMGYVLPWGQMSFWGATVITNLFSAIPGIGNSIVQLLWGGFSVDNPTLNRFFSLHYFMPFVIAGVALLHLILLHQPGSNNPLGVSSVYSRIPFYPYFYVKDLFGFFMFVWVFSMFVIYAPNYMGHPDNYIEANPLVTPAHIVPEWYFLPFYAVLRTIPDKLGGVVLMGVAIVILALLPVVDTSKFRSNFFKPLNIWFFWYFFADSLSLGWIGQEIVESPFIEMANFVTTSYFAYFLFLLPLVGFFENSVTQTCVVWLNQNIAFVDMVSKDSKFADYAEKNKIFPKILMKLNGTFNLKNVKFGSVLFLTEEISTNNLMDWTFFFSALPLLIVLFLGVYILFLGVFFPKNAQFIKFIHKVSAIYLFFSFFLYNFSIVLRPNFNNENFEEKYVTVFKNFLENANAKVSETSSDSFHFVLNNINYNLNDALQIIQNNSLFMNLFVIYSFFMVFIFFFGIVDRFFIANSSDIEYALLVFFIFLGSLFVFYVHTFLDIILALETVTLASYILVAFERQNRFSTFGGVQYFILGSIPSGMLLLGAGMLYKNWGTLALEDLDLLLTYSYVSVFNFNFFEEAISLGNVVDQTIANFDLNNFEFLFKNIEISNFVLNSSNWENLYVESAGFMFITILAFLLLMFNFFFKITAAPFQFWAPSVYGSAPIATVTFLSIFSKGLIFFLIYKVITLVFHGYFLLFTSFFLFCSVLSIFFGMIGAFTETVIKRFFVYSSMGHVGFILVGLAFFSLEGAYATFHYLPVYILSSFMMWFTLLHMGKKNTHLIHFNTLRKSDPVLALLFAFLVFSMSGIPPLGGFFIKLDIMFILLESHKYYLNYVLFMFTVASFYYYLRVLKIIFFDSVTVNEHKIQKSNIRLWLISVFFLILFFYIFFIQKPLLVLQTEMLASIFGKF